MSNKQEVYLVADTHFSHKGIIKHQPLRVERMGLDMESDNWIEDHDEYIISQWNDKVQKKDRIYIVGDFSFANSIETAKILSKLKGEKHLILGNHDKSSNNLPHYKSISQIKEVTFKPHEFEFLEEDFNVVMCHYAMVTWNAKHWGAVQIMGHSHGNLDDYNLESGDLRVDVGYDGGLAQMDLVSLEQVYQYMKQITGGQNLREWAIERRENMKF